MKRIYLIMCSIVLLASCESSNDEVKYPVEGPWKDNIGLPYRELNIAANEDVVTVQTKSHYWWFTFAKAGEEYAVPTDNKDMLSGTWFTTEKKDAQIQITIDKNNTSKERTLRIGLQNGNYFDGLTVTQKK